MVLRASLRSDRWRAVRLGSLAVAVLAALVLSAVVPVESSSTAAYRAPYGSSAPRSEPASRPMAPAPAWASLTLAGGPAARWATPMAYDAFDQVVVVAGGYNGYVPVHDTWIMANGTWTNLTSTLSAAPPVVDRMVYDPDVSAVVAYGANSGVSVTWEFQHLAWTNVTPGVSPTPRWRTMMTYDPSAHAVLLFGGQSTASTSTYGDTWEFKNGTWSAVTTLTSPAARARGMLTWDAHDNVDVLLGGFPSYGRADYGDTWTFSAGAWTNVTSSGGPSARDGAFWAYDPNYQAVLLYAGFYTNSFGGQGTDFDMWAYAGGTWSQLHPSYYPGARALMGVTYYPPWRDLLMFGGYQLGGYPIGDTWVWGIPLTSGAVGHSPREVLVGSAVMFAVQWVGGAGPFQFAWRFGDGSVNSTANTTHVYRVSGTYQAVFTISDALRSSLTFNTTVPVIAQVMIVGKATYQPREPASGAPVSFSVPVTGGAPPYSINWTFGDGAVGIGTGPSHTYSTAGTWNGTVSVSDVGGASRSGTFTVRVVATALVVGKTTYQPREPLPGTLVGFSVPVAGGAPPYSINWTFGDGAVGIGTGPSHTYSTAGTWNGTVNVSDAWGGSLYGTFTVRVAASALAVSSPTATPGAPTAGESITLAAAASGGITPYNFSWTFGDGAVGYGTPISHRFSAAGSYAVKISVRDALGMTSNGSLGLQVQSAGGGPSPGGAGGSAAPPFLSSILFWALAGGIAGVALVVTAVLRERRRMPAEPKGGPG